MSNYTTHTGVSNNLGSSHDCEPTNLNRETTNTEPIRITREIDGNLKVAGSQVKATSQVLVNEGIARYQIANSFLRE